MTVSGTGAGAAAATARVRSGNRASSGGKKKVIIGAARATKSADKFEGEMARAPVELTGQFLACIMAQDFKQAEILCRQILMVEPSNQTVLEFLPVIREKIALDEDKENDQDSDDSDDDTDAEDDEGIDDGGDGENDEDEDDEEEGEQDRTSGHNPSGILLRHSGEKQSLKAKVVHAFK